MKKIMIVILAFILSACINVNITPAQPEPVEPEPEPEPVPIDQSPISVEHVYQLNDSWIVYDFELEHEKQTYEINYKLKLALSGQETEKPYCQGPCIVYDDIKANGKDISLLENLDLQVNSGYGKLTLYNLNNELYLLNFNYAAQYNSCAGVVLDSEGNIVKEYNGADLTMNEIYQEQFGLSYYNPETNESVFEVYEADGSTLNMQVMN